MDYVNFDREPPANLTTMIMAFGGWINAGRAATGAVRYLIRHLAAPRLASIDPEDFFTFTHERPHVRMTTDNMRDIRWPSSEFFMVQPDEGQDGLLLFRGREPHLKWRAYTTAFLDVAERCGVKQIISLGAVLAGLPHTRPPLVTGRSADPDGQAQLEAWGIYRRPRYEGPTGISAVVLDEATRRGLPSLSFSAQAPHYLERTENPAVIQALLSYVERLLNLGLHVSQLDEAIDAFRVQCDRALSQNPSLVAHVRKLEQEYDKTVAQEQLTPRQDDFNSDQFMQELEDFLRQQREEGHES
ncbi:MAG: hypothetical protein ETSY1_16485 [Candidatus Entotheonella factor]|uniref:Carboxylate-amine ligase n=1 Tax=Entotheonella factor TaxID=1429438 RepID=W4LMU5_ENTF1|nr:PAC2 family protein [Candidatus Entotheonella palauensis]ETW99030.1 MAG: hypothetical protein ETSY1_16485 [Candidatus Entotheonella factor]